MQFSNRKCLIALVTSCCLLASQIGAAEEYQMFGATLSCPSGTHVVNIPEHWEQGSGRLVGAKYMCVPVSYYYHYSCHHRRGHCYRYMDRVNALKDGIGMGYAYKQ